MKSLTAIVFLFILLITISGFSNAAERSANAGKQNSSLSPSYAKAASELETIHKAAEEGDINNIRLLWSIYLFGDGEAVPQDYKQAVYWLQKGVEQEDYSSQNTLGTMYHAGQGVPQDYKQAIYWFTKAARQGDAIAQLNLGNMYANGEGVPQDYKQGYAWLSLAAMSGGIGFVESRDEIAKRLTPKGLEEAQALGMQLQKKIDSKEN